MEYGDCFKVETSFGDERASWFVYSRVTELITDYVVCNQFETRSDGVDVVYRHKRCRISILENQTSIDVEEWLKAWKELLPRISLL